MSTTTKTTVKTSNGRVRQPAHGVGRLVRRLERERRKWSRNGSEIPTEQAWRAGIAEGLRLAQTAIRRGV